MAVNPYMSMLAAALAGQSPRQGGVAGQLPMAAPGMMPTPTYSNVPPPPLTAGDFNLSPNATAAGAGGLGVPGTMPIAGQPNVPVPTR